MAPSAESQTSSARRYPDLRGVLDALIADAASDGDGNNISIEDTLHVFSTKSFGPLILAPALLLTLPTGILPGVPLALGLVIILIAVQMLFGRNHAWLPKSVRRIHVSREALIRFRRKSDRWLSRIDRTIAPRFEFMFRPPMIQIAALICIGLAIALIPVEVIPFATAIPGTALILVGLALTTHDGLLMMAAFAVTGGTSYFLLSILGMV